MFFCPRCSLVKNVSLYTEAFGKKVMSLAVSHQEPPRNFSRGIAVFGDFDWNGSFYHFELFNILPLFQLLLLHNLLYVQKVLLSFRRPWQKEQLLCFGFSKVELLNQELHLETVALGFPLLVGGLGFPENYKRDPCTRQIYVHMQLWRDVHAKCFGGNQTGTGLKLLFLNRPSRTHRYVKNWDVVFNRIQELRQKFPRWHFEYSDLDRVPFGRQYALLSQTNLVVGMHGAGLIHMLFMGPGSRLIELSPYLFENVGTFRLQADCLGTHHELFLAKRNSSFPANVVLRAQVENDVSLLYTSYKHRKNIRDQYLVLDSSEIEWLKERVAANLAALEAGSIPLPPFSELPNVTLEPDNIPSTALDHVSSLVPN